MRERLVANFHRLARRRFDADLTIMGYEGAIQSVGFLSLVFFLYVGARQVLDGELTVGRASWPSTRWWRWPTGRSLDLLGALGQAASSARS